MNVVLRLCYDGSSYLGWQKTKEGPSIEEELQKVLEKIIQKPLFLQAASRTDAGVHALDQVVNFQIDKEIDLSALTCSINSLLPDSIRVLSAKKESIDFHPTLHCCSKEYRYYVDTGKTCNPLQRHTCWHYPYPLTITTMQELANMLCGTKDFTAFSNRQNGMLPENRIRQLFSINIAMVNEDLMQFTICGQSFLYKMVRNLVGSLLQVGAGTLTTKHVLTALQEKDRTLLGITAPAKGLQLAKVSYSEKKA